MATPRGRGSPALGGRRQQAGRPDPWRPHQPELIHLGRRQRRQPGGREDQLLLPDGDDDRAGAADARARGQDPGAWGGQHGRDCLVLGTGAVELALGAGEREAENDGGSQVRPAVGGGRSVPGGGRSVPGGSGSVPDCSRSALDWGRSAASGGSWRVRAAAARTRSLSWGGGTPATATARRPAVSRRPRTSLPQGWQRCRWRSNLSRSEPSMASSA